MRVLVVEDEPTLQANLAQALRDAGYTVDTAADGQDALHLGSVEPYDAVVLDLEHDALAVHEGPVGRAQVAHEDGLAEDDLAVVPRGPGVLDADALAAPPMQQRKDRFAVLHEDAFGDLELETRRRES